MYTTDADGLELKPLFEWTAAVGAKTMFSSSW